MDAPWFWPEFWQVIVWFCFVFLPCFAGVCGFVWLHSWLSNRW